MMHGQKNQIFFVLFQIYLFSKSCLPSVGSTRLLFYRYWCLLHWGL